MTTTKTTLRGHCPCCGNLQAAPRIQRGDKKLYDGLIVIVASTIDGARVYYNGNRSWIGTKAWRNLPDAA